MHNFDKVCVGVEGSGEERKLSWLDLFAEELPTATDQAVCCSASLSTIASWGCGTLSSGSCISCNG